jgi:hypothetical protein
MCGDFKLNETFGGWVANAITYRNTIAGSPPGERIFIFLEKIRFAFQKLNFSKKK